MEKYHKSPVHEFSVFKPILFLLLFILWPACAEKKMTLEEAKQVTVSMSEEPFVPPPRHIDDILNLLHEQEQVDTEVVERLKARADALPPENANNGYLARFYFRRGFAAWELGRERQALEDYRMALQYVEKSSLKGRKILLNLAKAEKKFGNFRQARELLERMREDSRSTAMFTNLVSVYAGLVTLKMQKRPRQKAWQSATNRENVLSLTRSSMPRLWRREFLG